MKKLLSTLLFLFVVAIFSFAQTDVYPPTLMEPEDGDDGQMPDVILNWAAVAGSGGIVEYEVQLDVTDAFTDPVIFPLSEFTGLQMELLLFGQEYFWRVRASEGSDISGWSDVFSFVVFETVVLNKPNDGANEQDPDVLFKAKDRIGSIVITGVEHFEFQADTSANFDSPLLFEGVSETYTINASFLHFGEIYNWRARATHSADNSAWSEVRTFEVIPAPELDDPSTGSTDMGLENVLEWDELSGVLDYEIELADNDAFTGSIKLITEETEYTTDGYLTFDQEYFWRVRANHATDTSYWSEVWDFKTITTVALSLPLDGATDVGISPRLEWDMVSGVDFFQVQYNTTPDFEEPCCIQEVEGTDDYFQVINILAKDCTYYWHCRTMKGIDTTAWSETWSFTTEPEIGISETAFDENNINIYPNPSSGKLFIDVAGEENYVVTVYVMDLLGQIHVEENLLFGQGNTIKTLDLNDLANGLYLVKLTNGNRSYSHKITVYK
ncbi:MAG: T9SS type A sorting domain-containing protein [Bacteroidetes bacterium]|nr:T9SS type A sorting domain-containing protein [Bacteroidota bacterium]MCK5765136.1 T9SS type A sorting domain-containing protein [Bacteroidales bacterium]